MGTECSARAYEKLVGAGIGKRVAKVAEDVEHALLYKTILDGRVGEVVADSLSALHSDEFSDEFHADVQELEEKLRPESIDRLEDRGLLDHPYLFAGVVLGRDMRRFKKYGFGSEREFAEAVTAYCVGERHMSRIFHDKYVWRNEGMKNVVSLIDGDDTSVLQADVSGKGPMLRDVERTGFCFGRDSSQFLAIALKYVDFLGMRDIDEIGNWVEHVRAGGKHHPSGDGYEAWASGDKKLSFMTENLLTGHHLIGTKNNGDTSPSRIEKRDSAIWPIVSGRNMEIFAGADSGDVEIFPYGESRPGIKARKVAVYTPEDAAHLLKANHKLYSGSRTDMCGLMDLFVGGEEP